MESVEESEKPSSFQDGDEGGGNQSIRLDKRLSDFSITFYRKPRTNFLANAMHNSAFRASVISSNLSSLPV